MGNSSISSPSSARGYDPRSHMDPAQLSARLKALETQCARALPRAPAPTPQSRRTPSPLPPLYGCHPGSLLVPIPEDVPKEPIQSDRYVAWTDRERAILIHLVEQEPGQLRASIDWAYVADHYTWDLYKTADRCRNKYFLMDLDERAEARQTCFWR